MGNLEERDIEEILKEKKEKKEAEENEMIEKAEKGKRTVSLIEDLRDFNTTIIQEYSLREETNEYTRGEKYHEKTGSIIGIGIEYDGNLGYNMAITIMDKNNKKVYFDTFKSLRWGVIRGIELLLKEIEKTLDEMGPEKLRASNKESE